MFFAWSRLVNHDKAARKTHHFTTQHWTPLYTRSSIVKNKLLAYDIFLHSIAS